jgi:uncharacterized protein
MKVPALVDLTTPGTPVASPIDPVRLVAGSPVATVDPRYSDADGRFHCGLWSSSPGAWRVHYTEHEFCHLLRGHVRLTGDDGTVREFRTGAAFVIPSGYTGCWETLEDTTKYYVVYEPA